MNYKIWIDIQSKSSVRKGKKLFVSKTFPLNEFIIEGNAVEACEGGFGSFFKQI